MNKPPVIIVGAGFFGLTLAERIANICNWPVIILDRRKNIGGNAYSEIHKESGIEFHQYGSHLFHTSNNKVWEYVNNFDSFTNYQHTVWSSHKGRLYSLPFNLSTINQFYSLNLSPTEAKTFLDSKILKNSEPKNLEEKAISLIGSDLYEAFVKGYTQKQWQTDPRELDSEIISRIPVRYNYNNRYFSDIYEGLPRNGYSNFFLQMIQNSLIEVMLETDYFKIKEKLPKSMFKIFSGAIDEYFDYKYGRLNWRTLDFDFQLVNTADFQGTSVVNYPDLEYPYTRIHEFKHLHPERELQIATTLIAKEFSRSADVGDEPYYPVNTKEDKLKLKNYRELMKAESEVFFGGRLGAYKYLDMHMAIASALTLFDNKLRSRLSF